MNRARNMSVRLAVVLLPTMLLAAGLNRSGAPAFSTGAPGEGTCAACHTGNPVNSPDGSLHLVSESTYAPGETLDVTVRVAHPDAARFGFQITAQDMSGTPVGTFDVSGQNVQLALGSPDHVTHAPAADSNGEFEWVVPWQAPIEGAGEVTFYAAANAANADFTSSGDFIYTTAHPVAQGAATGTDREEDAVPVGFRPGPAYPNPVVSHARLTIPIEGRPRGSITLTLVDLAGRVVRTAATDDAKGFDSNFQLHTAGLTPGMYFARIGDGRSEYSIPFMVAR